MNIEVKPSDLLESGKLLKYDSFIASMGTEDGFPKLEVRSYVASEEVEVLAEKYVIVVTFRYKDKEGNICKATCIDLDDMYVKQDYYDNLSKKIKDYIDSYMEDIEEIIDRDTKNFMKEVVERDIKPRESKRVYKKMIKEVFSNAYDNGLYEYLLNAVNRIEYPIDFPKESWKYL